MANDYQIATKGVRAGQVRTEFQEHSEALFLTSSFVFKSARQAAARFAGEEDGMVYTRYTNPTVAMFQDRLAALEGAESAVGTASGMAAILATAMMLEHLGHSGPAARIEAAVQQDLAAHGNESRTTAQVGDGVLAALA